VRAGRWFAILIQNCSLPVRYENSTATRSRASFRGSSRTADIEKIPVQGAVDRDGSSSSGRPEPRHPEAWRFDYIN
jgi:hypothetical protein